MSSKNNGRISPSSGGAATQYIDFGSSHRIELSTGETGIGTTNTGYGIDLNNLSFSVAGTIETGLYFRRWGQISGVGPTDALWMLGRFVASPPLYKSEFRYLYADSSTSERAVMSLESTGTWATISDGTRRSLCEGFLNNGDAEPIFRLNASPLMGLELGDGGSGSTDIGFRRIAAGEAFIDNGGASDACGTLGRYVKVSAKASTPYTVTEEDGDKVFTNEGAAARITFNLPTAAANKVFTFVVQDADGIRVQADTGDTIRIAGSVSASAGYAQSTTIGDSLTIVAINATQWVATSMVGSGWSVV